MKNVLFSEMEKESEMRTYKIAAGAKRNTEPGDYFFSVDKGEEGAVHIPAMKSDAVIRINRVSRDGGSYTIKSLTLGELLEEVLGL